MRIIGGNFRGREIFQPSGTETRPLNDRAREAMFDILGDIEGLSALDLYAGSGAIGLEAVSRGAKSLDAVERSKVAAEIIRTNVHKLQADDKYNLFVASVEDWLLRNEDKKFDLIFIFPPFKTGKSETMQKAARLLNKNGTMAIETSRYEPVHENIGAELVKSRRYGESVVSFYKSL